MKRIRRLLRQFLRFSMVGISCFCLDYGIMVLLTEAVNVDYFWASATSYTIATIVNYILSMRFVFRGKEDMNRWTEMLIFLVLSLIGLGLNQMIMWVVVEQVHIHYMLAKIFSTLMVTTYNFISRKIFLE